MGSMNRVTLIGRLGADPELKYTPNSTAVCNFSLATSETWKKDGQKQEKTEWHKIVVWRELAETCSKYLAKGREVCLEGKLETSSYDKDGVKHWVTKVIADRVVFLGSASGNGERSEEAPRSSKHRNEKAPAPDSGPPEDDDGIPF